MNANVYVIEDYENEPPSGPKKTNPIQTQFLQRPKMNVNLYVIEDYENEPPSGPKKTNPIQTQTKPIL